MSIRWQRSGIVLKVSTSTTTLGGVKTKLKIRPATAPSLSLISPLFVDMFQIELAMTSGPQLTLVEIIARESVV